MTLQPPLRTFHRTPVSWLLLAAVGLAGCGAQSQAHGSAERASRPNVILISIDTLRADHVGCYGYERDTTPHLDALAEQSLLFETAYTTMSWTLIAHMSMLTGLYPSQHKVWKEDAVLSPSVPTLAERLREEGYHTLGFYDTTAHWVDPEFGYDRGFDLYQAHEDAEQASANVRKALAERPEGKPFFLFVHLFDVHNMPLKKHGDPIYDPPAPFDACFVEDARERLSGSNTKKWWYEDAAEATAEQREAVVALYDSGVRYVDDHLGRWFEEWKQEGLFDQSTIVVTADHGEGLCQRAKYYGGHGDAREEGLRVPFLLKLPFGQRGGTRASGPVSHVDILPTVLDLLELTEDERLPGYSLLAGRPADSIVYAERDETQVVIRWPYKLIQSTKRPEIGSVFDLEQDPLERAPVRVRSPDRERFHAIVDPMREAMAIEREGWFLPEDSGLRARPIDAATRKQLEELGYAGGEDVEPEEHGTSAGSSTSNGGNGAGD